MVLSRNTARTYEPKAEFGQQGVLNGARLYEGAALMNSTTGNPDTAQPLLASGVFLGIADREADNTNGLDNEIKVKMRVRGVITLTVVGVTGNQLIGVAVYALDDDSFTLTATAATQIGVIKEFLGGTRCKVAFEGIAARSI